MSTQQYNRKDYNISIGEICNREVVIVQPEDTVLQTTELIRQHHVGSVLIVDKNSGKPMPVGIVTDHDLVIEVAAPKLDPDAITVSDIMVSNFATTEGVRSRAKNFYSCEEEHQSSLSAIDKTL